MSGHDFESREVIPLNKNTHRVPPVWQLSIAGGAALVATASLAVTILALSGSAYQARPAAPKPDHPLQVTNRDRAAADRLAALAPRGVYLVVDSARNRLRVFSGTQVLREATCSTGTGLVLRDPRNGRSWVFDTPLGERRVQSKRRNPIWAKPEWAFIEEGFIPSTDPRDRFDDVSLGDYALYLGDGYLIHGTLFQSLLGRPVTHGCIRLGDEDLEYVYHTVPLGTHVYLY